MKNIKKIFLVGSSLSHSLSDKIHSYWMNYYKILGSYHLIEITEKNFSKFLFSSLRNNFIGGNITFPYKEKAYKLLNKYDETSKIIGSINTVYFDHDVLCGSNTDYYGFMYSLDDCYPNWEKDNALIIGAGGACRSIIFALKKRHFKKIYLINRNKEKALNLANSFGKEILVLDWESINDYIRFFQLIINTTPLGTKNYIDIYKNKICHFDFKKVNSDTIVVDIVYNPLITPFLSQARNAGLKIVNGIGMLLHQASLSFECWFNIRPKITEELKEIIYKKIQ